MRTPKVPRRHVDPSLLFVLNRMGNAMNAADDLGRCGFDVSALSLAPVASESDELAVVGADDQDMSTFAAALQRGGMQIHGIANYSAALQVHKDLIAAHDDIADIARVRVLLVYWDEVVRKRVEMTGPRAGKHDA